MVGAGPCKDVLLSWGTRLYEEYGRHESLQSCVRKYREVGHSSPEARGALEWLLLHHTPEVAEREGKDPLDVLLTTVYLGGCDMEEFVRAVVECLEGDPAVERRLVEASKEFKEFVHGSLLTFESLQTQVYSTLCMYILDVSVRDCVYGMYSQACTSLIANCDTSLQGGINYNNYSLLTSDFLDKGHYPASP